VLLGASGYAFLTLTARAVPAEGYAALASLYLLVALVGPGLFVPVEQETARLVSRAQALRRGARDQVRAAAQLAGAMAAVAILGLLALYPLLVGSVFHGDARLWLALVASVAGYAGACVLRGVFAGQRRLRPYAVCVGTDGLTRLLPCAFLAAAGVGAAWTYGLALGLGSVVGLLAVLPWFRPGASGPTVGWRQLIGATGWLVAAWGLSMVLANIAPVIVTAVNPDAPRLAGIFAFAFVLARVPVFVLVSLQAIILPALTRAAAAHDLDGLRDGVRRALRLVGVLGVGALILTVPLCRWLIGVVFAESASSDGAANSHIQVNPHDPARIDSLGIDSLGIDSLGIDSLGFYSAGGELPVFVLLLLAIGAVLAMLVQVLQPALIAVAGHRLVAAAWVVGTAVFGLTFSLPLPTVPAAAVAQAAAGATTAMIMGITLRRHLRTG
jgi:O-antigen/teichoic acid export membrane protein